MTTGPARARRTRSSARGAVVATVAVIGTLVGFLAWQAQPSSLSSAASPLDLLLGQDSGALGEAGGGVPDGTTAFDDDVPAVAKLDPELLDALRRATADAADDGIGIVVNSGWRSAAYQEELLEAAVAEHGSAEEAARWVASPETSAHVSGDAVDVGPAEATGWLTEHGATYGLCQIYDNEPWHYELRPDAAEDGCPPRYADPTQDPRLQ